MNLFPIESSPVRVARRVAHDVTTAHLAAMLVATSTLRQLAADGRSPDHALERPDQDAA